jgi:hypothetical protein
VSAIRTYLPLVLIVVVTGNLQAASPPLIEVEVAKEKLQGRVDAHNDQLFWLMGQDGRLRGLTNDKVKKFHQVSPRFSSYTASVLRDQLRHELGKSFDVVGTRHYTVCAVGDSKARSYAETFEDLFRSFQAYFSVRGFKVNEPEFPLVAIVFPNYESFARYAAAEDVSVSKNLKGYYLSTSNRVALYEDAASASAQQSLLDRPRDLPVRSVLEGAASFPFELPLHDGEDSRAWGAIEGSLKDTMIHEATHQVAFNTGLHSRIGASPKWVVEGLATVFEAPGIRSTSSNSGVKTRINRQRYLWFGNFSQSRRKPKSLEGFISSDDFFKSEVLDAYSEAWAFSFFLVETRPRAYSDYLRAIAAHDPLEAYPPQARLADFKRTVSKEIPLLESEFLRFMAGIK